MLAEARLSAWAVPFPPAASSTSPLLGHGWVWALVVSPGRRLEVRERVLMYSRKGEALELSRDVAPMGASGSCAHHRGAGSSSDCPPPSGHP